MFLRLIQSIVSMMFFGFGFLLIFFLNILNNQSIQVVLKRSLLGGVLFLLVWAVLIKMLQALFSEQELKSIFFPKETETAEGTEYIIPEDDEDLTIDELYKHFPVNEEDLNFESSNSKEFIDLVSTVPVLETDFSSDAEEILDNQSNSMRIGADGMFNFETGNRTVRVTPKEGAMAARKVLMDEKE